jgi:hypothetical protein
MATSEPWLTLGRSYEASLAIVEDPTRSARRLYEQRGYQVVGELTDYIVEGHSEILLRKTHGPLTSFTPRSPQTPE